MVRELQKVYKEKLVLHGRAGKLGLGSAYIDGLSKCTGDFIILMDADLSHHVSLSQSPLIFMDFSLNLSQSLSNGSKKLTVIWCQALAINQVVAFMDGICRES